MKYLKLFEEYSRFAVVSNQELIILISELANRLKSFSERDLKDNYHYTNSIKVLTDVKEEIYNRIDSAYKMEQGEDNKMMGDIMREINYEDGKFSFSVGMYKTLLKTIDVTIENEELTPIIEDGDDYVLFDEEKEYLDKLFTERKK
jgi:hypothetical protein